MEPEVKVGQVWADNDARARGRTLEVLEVGENHAVCKVLTPARFANVSTTGRTVRIMLRRFKPNSTGYRLLEDTK